MQDGKFKWTLHEEVRVIWELHLEVELLQLLWGFNYMMLSMQTSIYQFRLFNLTTQNKWLINCIMLSKYLITITIQVNLINEKLEKDILLSRKHFIDSICLFFRIVKKLCKTSIFVRKHSAEQQKSSECMIN
ncbi:CLUMA_CG001185, isoform A [Clunio marinus]|uniref:CLUMA_CG001185, isoform A n=1 Tax=Clunio marinus TaxID=568069 RepID=A0A1J1HH83_9DIPT|nr:CLUMA_CG001185, isoform A [Clunio marinus]